MLKGTFDYNQNLNTMTFFILLILCIVLILLFRFIGAWMFRIDEVVSELQKINKKLERLSSSENACK